MAKVWNSEFVAAMDELETISKNRGEVFRARAYKTASDTLLGMTEDIIDIKQVENKVGIGSTIYGKLKSLMETGKINAIEKERGNVLHELAKIYGVGPKKAAELAQKVNSIDELKQDPSILNNVQKVGLKYFDEIQERIPRSEIDEYNILIQKYAKELNVTAEIVGSYRRGASSSGDIDVILTSDDKADFKNFMDNLIRDKVIIEVLSRGKTKSLTIGKLGTNTPRRIDFLYTSPGEYAFAVLYFTGSKAFNTVMRGHSLAKGHSLNEHGMQNAPKDKEFRTEKDIFDFLNLEFKEPIDRKNGHSVVVIGEQPKQKEKKQKKEKAVKAYECKGKIKGKELTGTLEEREHKCKEVSKSGECKTDTDCVWKKKEPEVKPELITISRDMIIKKETPKPELITVSRDMIIKKEISKMSNMGENKCFGKQKGKNLEGTIESRQEKCDKITKAGECKNDNNCTWKKQTVKSSTLVKKKSPKKMSYKGSEFNPNYKNVDIGDLVKLLRKASDHYYNSAPIMTDQEFDIIRDHIESIAPQHPVLKEIGAPIKTKQKIKLPYFMASMNKVKPDSLNKWIHEYTGPYCVSAKLDGVSGLFTQKSGVQKLYTRGNGEIGQDISHLIPYITSLSNITKEDIVVRGELIIPEKEFQERFSSSKSNSRNMVSGLVNSKKIQENEMTAMHFVVYEVIEPSLKPSDQFKHVSKNGYELVQNEYLNKITLEYASKTLQEWRKSGSYTIDGIILAQDEIYPRTNANPKHAVAFKMVLTDQTSESVVTGVTWATSKHGLLKPVVQIEPINIGGVVVKNISGQNARFIVNNGIGIGAILEVVRRGDVIPYIEKVLKVASKPSLPDGEYEWTATNVDIVVTKNDESQEQLALAFFKGLEVDGIGIGVIKKFNKAGFKTIPDILAMSKEDLLQIDGFKEKSAEKIYRGLNSLVENNFSKVTLEKLMGLSGAFGRGLGERKNREILKVYPDILIKNLNDDELISLVKTVPGFSLKTSTQFVEGLPKFKQFAKEIGFKFEYSKPTQEMPPVRNDSPLYGKSVVFTGGKDKEIIERITQKGGIIGSSVSAKTFAVITQDINSTSSKAKKAISLGLPVYTIETFKEMYLQ